MSLRRRASIRHRVGAFRTMVHRHVFASTVINVSVCSENNKQTMKFDFLRWPAIRETRFPAHQPGIYFPRGIPKSPERVAIKGAGVSNVAGKSRNFQP